MLRSLIFVFFILFSTSSFAASVKEIKTASGITAWLVEEHSQPLISVKIAFKDSGTGYDIDGKEGRTTMTTAMLLEGAGDMDSESFNRSLEENAIYLSFSADTDNFYASFATLSENKEKAFHYLSLALTKPRFDDAAFDRVKRQTLLTIKKQQEKPSYKLERAWQKQIFGAHPYSKPFATKEAVERLTSGDLREFVESYLTRENMVISVVGDIGEQELAELLEKNLKDLPANYKPDVTLTDISVQKEAQQKNLEQDIPQTIIQFSLQGLKRDDPDYVVGYVLNHLLGGGTLTSRLNDEIREKRGLTYSASTSLTPMRHAAILSGRFATRTEKVDEAISVLKQVLKDMAEKGITEQELADAKRFITGSFVVGLDSNNDVIKFLNNMQLNNLGIDYMEKRNKLINSVTSKQINEMAKRLLQLDKLQIVTIGKQ